MSKTICEQILPQHILDLMNAPPQIDPVLEARRAARKAQDERRLVKIERRTNALSVAAKFRPKDLQLLARVLARCKLGRPAECWPWEGAHSCGYGRINIDGRVALAHRASAFAIGMVSDLFDPERSACVLHKCDNPACCNPRHFFIGTQSDNMQDCSRKGRAPGQKGKVRLP